MFKQRGKMLTVDRKAPWRRGGGLPWYNRHNG